MATRNKNSVARTPGEDPRVRRSVAPQVRGDRGVVEDATRANETGLASDMDELEKLLQNEFEQVALPTPPSLPGWHLCWLTTGSAYDTLAKRQRLGYEPVKQGELPGFNPAGANSAQFEGVITCNEMVLFKIREERFQAIMFAFHHKRPLEEESAIYEAVESQMETSGKDKKGRPVIQPEEGFTAMGRSLEEQRSLRPRF